MRLQMALPGVRRWTVWRAAAAIGGALALLVALLLSRATRVFSGDAMLRTAREALSSAVNASDATEVVGEVERILRRDYSRHIVTDEQWILNNAGGAMGAMKVLHFSLTEYVIIFGTAVGTEGHTGRFSADDYFTILYGEQWAFTPGSMHKEVYRAGEQHVLRRGVAKQYRMPDATWALEYAHGNMLAMLPFGVADAMFSTLDWLSVCQTASVAIRGIVRALGVH